jgi:hypothetical protein
MQERLPAIRPDLLCRSPLGIINDNNINNHNVINNINNDHHHHNHHLLLATLRHRHRVFRLLRHRLPPSPLNQHDSTVRQVRNSNSNSNKPPQQQLEVVASPQMIDQQRFQHIKSLSNNNSPSRKRSSTTRITTTSTSTRLVVVL